MSSYKVPSEPLDVEETIKNSLFTTRARNVSTAEAAKDFVREMNRSFPDASHHCWAYIVGNPSSTTLIGCSDDGEPSGTAGKPMLHVLLHSDIGDIVVVCTRYFGGTKLGTGGLARAYGGGTKLALKQLPLKEKINYIELQCELEYSQLKDFEHTLSEYQVGRSKFDYQGQILASFSISESDIAQFKLSINNQFKGQITWNTIPS
ncbi:MAG: YigZ family protein [Kangiellaceae bacterium]|nr:YigZ family protein [Kangiellaceae bacterium]